MFKGRKIPLLNEFECRGRVIGKGGSKDVFPFLRIFIRSKRKHNYLKIHFHPSTITDVGVNQYVYVKGFVKSNLIPYLYEGKKEQYLFGESINHEKTELEEVFEIENIGFAYRHSFSRVYLSGLVQSITESNDWIKIQIRDYKEQVIALQYSKRMRVYDIDLQTNDFVMITAFVVSSKKIIGDKLVHFEDLIVDDMEVN